MSKKYWFPAKRYGWGWGFPSTWQGWSVFAGYLGLLLLGVGWIDPEARLDWYLAYVGFLTVGFVLIVRAKGEPPRWRWGADEPGSGQKLP